MKVLVGVDGSDPGYRALEEALDRAREAGDDLTIAIYGEDVDRDAVHEIVEERLAEDDVSAAVQDLVGDPGSRLVELADQHDYDRLVIGGGSRSPMGKIRLNSAAEFVLLNATTTVTLVR